MNRQERLLRNYILSEVYSIEKNLFLKENNYATLSEGLLVEGKLWDWTKNLYKKVKSNFELSPEENDGFDEMIEEAEAAGKHKRAEEIDDLRNSIAAKRFRNQNLLILGVIVTTIFNLTGDFNKVKEALNDPGIKKINTNNPKTSRAEAVRIMDRYIPDFDEKNFISDQPVESSEEKKLNPVIIGLERALELGIQKEEEWLANKKRELDKIKKINDENPLVKMANNIDQVEETKKMKNRFQNMSGIVELEGLFNSYDEYIKALMNPDSEAHNKMLEAVRNLDQEAFIDALTNEALEKSALNHSDEDSVANNLESLLFDLQEAPGDLDPEIKEIKERINQMRHDAFIAQKIAQFPEEVDGFDGNYRQNVFFKYGREKGYIGDDGQPTDHPFANSYYDIAE